MEKDLGSWFLQTKYVNNVKHLRIFKLIVEYAYNMNVDRIIKVNFMSMQAEC